MTYLLRLALQQQIDLADLLTVTSVTSDPFFPEIQPSSLSQLSYLTFKSASHYTPSKPLPHWPNGNGELQFTRQCINILPPGSPFHPIKAELCIL